MARLPASRPQSRHGSEEVLQNGESKASAQMACARLVSFCPPVAGSWRSLSYASWEVNFTEYILGEHNTTGHETCATDNLGDQIIMDAVRQVVSEVLPSACVYRVATHEYMSWVSRRLLQKSAFAIVGGTKLLSSAMGRFSLWKVMPWDVRSLNRTILLGAGWRSYMGIWMPIPDGC